MSAASGSGRVCRSDRRQQNVNTNYTEHRAEAGIELYSGSFGGLCDNALTKMVAGSL